MTDYAHFTIFEMYIYLLITLYYHHIKSENGRARLYKYIFKNMFAYT